MKEGKWPFLDIGKFLSSSNKAESVSGSLNLGSVRESSPTGKRLIDHFLTSPKDSHSRCLGEKSIYYIQWMAYGIWIKFSTRAQQDLKHEFVTPQSMSQLKTYFEYICIAFISST